MNEWGIIDKIGTFTVDNAAANDVALQHLRQTFSVRKKLLLEGKMFHARCCAHILNLCVQDGLDPTRQIVDKIRDGVKFVAVSEGRTIKFAEISMSLGLKCKKLILFNSSIPMKERFWWAVADADILIYGGTIYTRELCHVRDRFFGLFLTYIYTSLIYKYSKVCCAYH